MLWALSVPPGNSRNPTYTAHVLATLHRQLTRHDSLRLILGSHQRKTGLFLECSRRLQSVVPSQFAANYPDLHLKALPDDAFRSRRRGEQCFAVQLRFHPDLFALPNLRLFEDALQRTVVDPLQGLLATVIPQRDSALKASIALTLRPAGWWRRRRMSRLVQRLQIPAFIRQPDRAISFARMATSPRLWLRVVARVLSLFPRFGSRYDRRSFEQWLQSAEAKANDILFEVDVQLQVIAPKRSAQQAKQKLREMAAAFAPFQITSTIGFTASGMVRHKRQTRPFRTRGSLLSPTEVALLWHPPTETVEVETQQTVWSRELEPPTVIPAPQEQDVAVLGQIKFRSRQGMVGLRQDDRRRHLAIMGKTGMGKTTLLKNLITSDMHAGRGVALIDPHGDLADELLNVVPKHRTNDVVLFDPADREHPIAFNPFQCHDPTKKSLVVSGIVTAFKKLYGDSWGPRLEYILSHAVSAIVETPDTNLLSLQRMLLDRVYRQRLALRLTDPVVKDFWLNEFAQWNSRYRTEAIAPVLNKVGRFAGNELIRNILGNAKGKLNLRKIMDDGKILIVNVGKGRIGEDVSTLLGSLLLTMIQLSVMSREDTPEQQRRDFYLYVDEFQNFATESFATMLSEARKYRLSLTVANQYLAQLDEAGVTDALFGNVGSLLCFQMGSRDAKVIAEQLSGSLTPQDLIALPKYTAYLRLLLDGTPSRPFSIETLKPTTPSCVLATPESIRRASRRRYARSRQKVEREVKRQFR